STPVPRAARRAVSAPAPGEWPRGSRPRLAALRQDFTHQAQALGIVHAPPARDFVHGAAAADTETAGIEATDAHAGAGGTGSGGGLHQGMLAQATAAATAGITADARTNARRCVSAPPREA